MNKDVYYIEPEDDITDIITHLRAAKQKIIALVPPKKISVLRSVINLKLIAKTAKTLDKAVVIITLDPALMKLSAASGLPFSRNLQSRPVLPSEFKDSPLVHKATAGHDQIIDDDEAESLTNQKNPSSNAAVEKSPAMVKKPSTKPASSSKELEDGKDSTVSLTADELDESQEPSSKIIKKIPSFEKLRKWIILGIAATIILIAGGIWAFVFAPAAKIAVKIKTTPDNFSEKHYLCYGRRSGS